MSKQQPRMQVNPTGIMQQVPTQKAHATLPAYNGRHYFIVIATFHVTEPARSEHHLDTESLITVDGPSCLHCEQTWSPTMGVHCPGDPK